jgi:hypothetical protein
LANLIRAEELSVPIEVYGPETHMTAIVSMALGLANGDPEAAFRDDNMGRSLVDVDDDPMSKQTSAERKVRLDMFPGHPFPRESSSNARCMGCGAMQRRDNAFDGRASLYRVTSWALGSSSHDAHVQWRVWPIDVKERRCPLQRCSNR